MKFVTNILGDKYKLKTQYSTVLYCIVLHQIEMVKIEAESDDVVPSGKFLSINSWDEGVELNSLETL